MSDRRSDARLQQLSSALADLEAFSAEPIVTKRDRAGVIKAFEYTYELFWKCMQAAAEKTGMSVAGPKPSLKAAFKLGIIEDEAGWLDLADHRNLTSHTYNEQLAIDLCRIIVERYLPLMLRTKARLVPFL
jgi:nucleotidyltransferase substrate binding protein (TIGR01987 family)